MPIEFFETPSGIHVRQSFVSPTVYLDHWAIRMFSDDIELQDQFVELLRNQGGTLLISMISLGEFAGPSDPTHAIATEAFIERLLPNIYLTDFAFDKLVEREREEPDNALRFWPSSDLRQLKLLGECAQHSPTGLTFQGFIQIVTSNRDTIGQLMEELVQIIIGTIKDGRADPGYISKAKKSKPDINRPRTHVIIGELMRQYYLDLSLPIKRNDIVDLLHAAMTINSCDFVLLDGAWAGRVAMLKERIETTGLVMPLAKCFSKRNAGVQTFLSELEAFDPLNPLNLAVPY